MRQATPIQGSARERVRRAGGPYGADRVLDWMLVLGRPDLERIPAVYTAHYNGRRPHRGLGLNTPEPQPRPARWPAEVLALDRTRCCAD
jgi:hypothetical protein